MKRNLIIYIFAIAAVVSVAFTSCIEDSFTSSPSDQPAYSVDTLKMGEAYTLEGTPTHRFTVYNRHDKMLNISSIMLRDDANGYFRLNVDGISGREFSNVEIRPNDSIFVFVEATLPENGSELPTEVESHLDFLTNGVTTTVVLNVIGQDAVRYRGLTIAADTQWSPGRPYIIYDTLRVAEGATLTLLPGARLRFHDKAAMKVDGTLRSEGTPEAPVEFTGDRTGGVVSTIPYELMSGQWGGIYFTSNSRGNYLTHTSIRNSTNGIALSPADTGGNPALTLRNCQIRNTKNYIIDACHANVTAVGCEFTDASQGILNLVGGTHIMNHCTIANYYLFTALGGPAIQFAHLNPEEADEESAGRPYINADFTNCIIYGNGTDLSHGKLENTGITIRRCLLKSAGSDDEQFIECLWDTDPLYYTVRNEYHFDYRLRPESPAIGAADGAYDVYGFTADRYGVAVASLADLGAYAYVAPAEE